MNQVNNLLRVFDPTNESLWFVFRLKLMKLNKFRILRLSI